MASQRAWDSTIRGILERLNRDEGVGAPAVIDLTAGGLEGATVDRLGAAPFVLVTGLTEASSHPLWLRLLASVDHVLLDWYAKGPAGHALFMRADRSPKVHATISGAVESIHGYLDEGQEQFLFEKVRSLPEDAVILEIGSYHGRSTSALAFACIGTRRRVYCVDLWGSADLSRHPGFFNQFKNNLSSRRLWPYVVPLHGPSAQVLGRWGDLQTQRVVRGYGPLFLNAGIGEIDMTKSGAIKRRLGQGGTGDNQPGQGRRDRYGSRRSGPWVSGPEGYDDPFADVSEHVFLFV